MTGRVAIYAAPGIPAVGAPAGEAAVLDPSDPVGAAGILRRRAESWLGRAVDGTQPDPTLPDGWTRAAVDEITVDARRYGFHGTLKAPFRLADGASLADLERDLDAFAATRRAVVIPRITLDILERFFALVPGEAAPDLHALADDVVIGFDRYRAPASAAELARRDPASLGERRRELLETYGYPYVLDEFRFHLTVTDRIPHESQPEVRDALTAWFAEVLDRPIAIESVVLFTEASPGASFQLHSVHPLGIPSDPSRAGRSHTGVLDHEGTR